MKKRTILISTAAAVALLPGLLSSCSSTPSSGSGGPSAANDAVAGAAKTAACMREKGFAVEDPKDDGFTIGVPDGADRDAFFAALGECEPKREGAGDGGAPGTELSAEDRKRDQKEVTCIRDGGFEDYPDDLDARAQYEPAGDPAAFNDRLQKCAEDVGSQGSTGAGE
jgi:hypothetical protein